MVEYAIATAGIRHHGAAIAEMDNSKKREARSDARGPRSG
jgi:hypothetical protein